MAAMKPRTGDGPLEVTKEGRDIVMRMPLDGGGRLVVEMTPDEANALGDALKTAAGWPVGRRADQLRAPFRHLREGARVVRGPPRRPEIRATRSPPCPSA
jgi:hypothetical protein